MASSNRYVSRRAKVANQNLDADLLETHIAVQKDILVYVLCMPNGCQ